MTIIEIILLTGVLWFFVEFVYYLNCRYQKISLRIFSSFAPSVLIHLSSFYAFYFSLGYLFYQMSPLHKEAIAFSWIAGGLAVVLPFIEVIRIRTDESWLISKWIKEELKQAEDPEKYVESLLVKIREQEGDKASIKALSALREIARKGDSTGGLVSKILYRNNLL